VTKKNFRVFKCSRNLKFWIEKTLRVIEVLMRKGKGKKGGFWGEGGYIPLE
jgi:hypothetical protein